MNVILPVIILGKYCKSAYGNIETLFGIGGVVGALIISLFGIGNNLKIVYKLSKTAEKVAGNLQNKLYVMLHE